MSNKKSEDLPKMRVDSPNPFIPAVPKFKESMDQTFCPVLKPRVQDTNPEFQTHRLNDIGIKKVEKVKQLFDELLNNLRSAMGDSEISRMLDGMESRGWKFDYIDGPQLSLIKTKLEEACMFAVKAVSCDPANQETQEKKPLTLGNLDKLMEAAGRGTIAALNETIQRHPETKTLTSGHRTYKLTLRLSGQSFERGWKEIGENNIEHHETITARSITAAIALLYEQHPDYSNVYRVVKVEEVSAEESKEETAHKGLLAAVTDHPFGEYADFNEKFSWQFIKKDLRNLVKRSSVKPANRDYPTIAEVVASVAQNEAVVEALAKEGKRIDLTALAPVQPHEFKFGVSEPDPGIAFEPTITINGAKLCASGLTDILNMVTQPNPRRWYRFERQGENLIVQTKQDEDQK
jgi:hypothetical protein